MLKKMMKHDMRAMWRTSMPMLLVSGVVSVICCGMLYFTLCFAENAETLLGALGLVGGFYLIGLMAVFVLQAVVAVFALVRYYKALFTDEGYLTMVLPIETASLLNAKILSVLIWWAISGAAALLAAFISLILPVMLYNGEILTGVIETVRLIIGTFIEPEYNASLTVLGVLGALVGFVENAVLTLSAITVGATVVKKRRLLGAFLFYFGITFIRENVISVFEALADIILVKSTNVSIGATLSVIFGILISAGITVGAYFLMKNIFTKKFNIE